jgi:hypothetical protein
MARKNPVAVALGRRKSAKKAASSARNGLLGGRPTVYRLTTSLVIQKRVDGRWVALHPPYDAATMAWLRRHNSSTE